MTTLVIGAVLFVIGTIGLKQQLFSHFPVELNVMTYSLIAVLLWKMCLKLQQRDVTLISGLAFVVGVVAVIQNGFTWWKLILLLFITFSQGAIAGVLAIDLLLVNVVYLLTEQSFQFPTIFYDYKWLPALLLSLGAILLLEYIVLDSNDFQLRQMYFKRNYYWTMVYLAYALCILYPLIFSNSNMEYGRAFLEKIVGTTMLQWLISDDILKIGIFGLVFSVFWSVRERMESWRKKSM